MRTDIHEDLINLPMVQEADAILRKCVHCGFCTATCPTYQLLGDELDGPRGRIYLIKNMLEDNHIDDASALHLDRCLTCRACETTCPSGVEYGRLLDIGRDFAGRYTHKPVPTRILSWTLRQLVPRRWLFGPLLRVGQFFRPLLPATLQRHVPQRAPVRHATTTSANAQVLLLTGCVQSSATPNVTASLAKILASQGISTQRVNEGCCGALDYHLAAQEAGIVRMKALIDQLYPRLETIDAIVSSATGCGVTLREYPQILAQEPEYALKAIALAAKIKDPVELIEQVSVDLSQQRIAVHTPCSMQHGMRLTGRIERLLAAAGAEIVDQKDGHLCCGSAGTYSILQSEISSALRNQKLANLTAASPDVIVTANIGCQLQLADSDGVPVMHWLELVADNFDRHD